MRGKFKGWRPSTSYGFITADDGDRDVFVHKRAVQGPDELFEGSILEFDIETDEKGRSATNVKIIEAAKPPERQQGVVKTWLEERGFGFLTPTDGGEDVFLHVSDLKETGTEYTTEGSVFSFLTTQSDSGTVARSVQRVGWERTGDLLNDYAEFKKPNWLEYLADNLAEKEPWEYSSTESNRTRPILRSYMKHTFHRLTDMERGIITTQNGVFSAFNTGLVTPNQEEIFGIFIRNNDETQRDWEFDGFYKESERRFVEAFGSQRPPLAEYFENPADLLFDRRLELYLDIDHILQNIDRFPERLRDNEFMCRQLLTSAEVQTKKRVYRNYKTAIPQFFRDRRGEGGELQLLLPICLENPSKADLALTVAKNADGTAYRGSTVLTLDMAYCNARLLARPDTEWLQP